MEVSVCGYYRAMSAWTLIEDESIQSVEACSCDADLVVEFMVA